LYSGPDFWVDPRRIACLRSGRVVQARQGPIGT
jgi:hypothetical protein